MFTTPRIIIQDPELIREVLTNKSGQFHKLPLPVIRRLTQGLSALEGEKWLQRKSIVTPAFHLTKLKVILLILSYSSSTLYSLISIVITIYALDILSH